MTGVSHNDLDSSKLWLLKIELKMQNDFNMKVFLDIYLIEKIFEKSYNLEKQLEFEKKRISKTKTFSKQIFSLKNKIWVNSDIQDVPYKKDVLFNNLTRMYELWEKKSQKLHSENNRPQQVSISTPRQPSAIRKLFRERNVPVTSARRYL